MSKCNVLERMEFLQHVFKVKLKERNSTQIGTQWINLDILIYSIILKCTEINSIICLFPLIKTGYVVILYQQLTQLTLHSNYIPTILLLPKKKCLQGEVCFTEHKDNKQWVIFTHKTFKERLVILTSLLAGKQYRFDRWQILIFQYQDVLLSFLTNHSAAQ